MKKTFFILAYIIFHCLSYGQYPPGRQATEKEQKLFDASHDCASLNIISLAERLKRYPFDKTKNVQLVSFKSSYNTETGEYYRDSLPRMNDTVCYSKLFEIITLIPSQVDRLTDLIYNYNFKFKYEPKGDVYFIKSLMACYNPRNAVLFLDKDNKVFEFIEICFECERTETSSEHVNFGTNCNQKLLLIKDFFKKSGIQYGVSKIENDE
jgi:hypothetical protein